MLVNTRKVDKMNDEQNLAFVLNLLNIYNILWKNDSVMFFSTPLINSIIYT